MADAADAGARRAPGLATISFAMSFAARRLVGGLAPIFSSLYRLTATQTAFLVAVPVLRAELDVADHVLASISGHLSRRMLEHYRTSASTRSGRRSMR